MIRTSGGVFSVPVLGAVLYSLLGVDTSNFQQFFTSATAPLIFPNPFGGTAAVQSYPGYRRANQVDLKDPRVYQWNFSIDQKIGRSNLLRLTYTGSRTVGLIYSPDLNQVQPNTIGYTALTATPELRQQNLKYPNFGEVLTRDNGPGAKYHSFTMEFDRHLTNGLQFQNFYTLSRNITNALGSAPDSNSPNGEGGTGRGDNGGNVLNYYDIRSDTGGAPYNRRHRFVSTISYELPFGRGKHYGGSVGRAADLLIFLTPTFTGTDPSGTNPSQCSEGSFQRPDCIGISGNLSNPTRNGYFNPAAFSVPANRIGRFGTCGVGILNGPGTETFSMTIGKGAPNTRFSNGAGTVNPNFGVISSVQGRTSGAEDHPIIVAIVLLAVSWRL